MYSSILSVEIGENVVFILKMAPLCVAGHLLLLQWLMFLLFITFATNQIESLLVYDRQALLNLRHNVGELRAFKHSRQKTVPPLLAGIPTHLCRASAANAG